MNFLEKEARLPENVKLFFRSNDSRLELERACFMYEISDENIGKISGPVGRIFVGDVKLEELPDIITRELGVTGGVPYGLAWEINQRIFNRFSDHFQNAPELLEKWSKLKSAPTLDENDAWKKVLEIEPWLTEEGKEEETTSIKSAPIEKIETSPIMEALRKYPQIKDQLLTTAHIKLAVLPDPVRPSIGNWITDYTYTLGSGHHDAIERGNYIFQGENGKKLSPKDKEKLTYLLTALDANSSVKINLTIKQIIFPLSTINEQRTTTNKIPTNPISSERISIANQQPTNNTIDWRNGRNSLPNENRSEEKISFSSPQVLPIERDKYPLKTKASIGPMRITPIHPKENDRTIQERPLPKNVINLKE